MIDLKCGKCGGKHRLDVEMRQALEEHGGKQAGVVAYRGGEPVRCPFHTGNYWLRRLMPLCETCGTEIDVHRDTDNWVLCPGCRSKRESRLAKLHPQRAMPVVMDDDDAAVASVLLSFGFTEEQVRDFEREAIDSDNPHNCVVALTLAKNHAQPPMYMMVLCELYRLSQGTPIGFTPNELADPKRFHGATTDEVKRNCPFCGVVYYADTISGDVVHLVPTCPEYDRAEDSLAFVIAVRRKLERGAN